MTNVLIVESKNDRAFLKALIEYLNLQSIAFQEPLCRIDDYECMEGLDSQKLRGALSSLKYRLPKEDVKAIGIILDHDGKQQERLDLINSSVRDVFATSEPIPRVGEFIKITVNIDATDTRVFNLGCFLTNVNQRGELETLLKEIKTQPSIYADCLNSWRECLHKNGKAISEKDFDKFWLNNYIRFDTCSDSEMRQAGRKCSTINLDYIMENKKQIWNFEHTALDDLKSFLRCFI